jgi:CheY-like chemotaxis protein
MLIDDDPDDQDIFLSALREISLSVICHTATNGRNAMEKLAGRQIIPELIFLDLNMPVMNGQQFLQNIKNDESLNNIPVIIFSTSSNPHTIEQTKKLGATDFITKPHHFGQLKDILQAIIL